MRGVANAGNLTPTVIFRLSQALGRMLREESTSDQQKFSVGMGGDPRISYDMIRSALCAGFTSLGCDVKDFGILPTPALAHLTRAHRLDLGLMISASHNPVVDNGIKVFDGQGVKLSDELEFSVEQSMDDPGRAPDLPVGVALGRVMIDSDGLEEYLIHLMGFFRGMSLQNLKVAVDCANGAACRLAPEILHRLGAKVVVMANDPDGTNINLDCGSVYPARLAELVKSEGCDMGFALDGDGDRCQFVDASGHILNGDPIMAFLALHMQRQNQLNQDTLVTTIMSNIGLELALKPAKIRLVRTDVGDRHVCARLRADDLSLGGEQSGHIIFGKENCYTGDGVFTGLKVLQVMIETGKSLADLASVMIDYPQVLINVDVTRKPPFEELPQVMEAVREVDRKLAEEGRVILRYSGTERKARVMVEGPDGPDVQRFAQAIAQAVKDAIG